MSAVTGGLPQNTIGSNTTGLGFKRTLSHSPAELDMPLSSSGQFQDMTVSFAIANNGNGYNSATLFYSTSGGGLFTQAGTVPIPTTTTLGLFLTFNVPAAANNAPNLVLRIELSGGQSNGPEVQTVIDNIQVNGTIAQTPSLGNYPNTQVTLGANSTITPEAAPANAASINVSTDTNFKGTFAADPATGVVRVTDAHPAGVYTVTVKAFNGALSINKTFQLTVQTGTACKVFHSSLTPPIRAWALFLFQ